MKTILISLLKDSWAVTYTYSNKPYIVNTSTNIILWVEQLLPSYNVKGILIFSLLSKVFVDY